VVFYKVGWCPEPARCWERHLPDRNAVEVENMNPWLGGDLYDEP
jgi:hypothetical protein